MSTKRIKRIDPMQSGKVTAIISVALILIIFIPIALLFSIAGLGSRGMGFGSFLGGGIFMLILGPIFYGIIGFIMGILYAYIYNYTYRFHGGLELEYDDMDDELATFGNNVVR